MRCIADLAYLLAGLLYVPVALYHALIRGKNRSGWAERFGFIRPLPDAQKRIWIHAVSLGEINATPKLAEALRQQRPDCDIVFSTTTDTGYARAVRLYGPERVFRFPLDFSFVVSRVLKHVRPALIVLVELEVWHNLTRMATKRGIPVAVVNGRLTERSARRLQLLGPPVRAMFRDLTWVGAQDEAIAARFRGLGVFPERVDVTSSMKWDTAVVADHIDGQEELGRAVGIDDARPVWVCGSTGPGEEAMILEAYRGLLTAQEHGRPSAGHATLPAGHATLPLEQDHGRASAGHATLPAGHATLSSEREHGRPSAGHATLPAGHATLSSEREHGRASAGHATLPAGHATLPLEQDHGRPSAGHATLPAGHATLPAGHATLPHLVIVPRKPERFDEVARLIAQAGFTCIRRSCHPDGCEPPAPSDAPRVILGDTMGELRKFYSLSDLAFAGRSLVPLGGSDPMEIAALGKPVIVGPHTDNFAAPVSAFAAADAIRVAQSTTELASIVQGFLADRDLAHRVGARAREVVARNQGATNRTAVRLGELLDAVSASRPAASLDIDPSHHPCVSRG
jgi:3-deoxy-D-manno-octulosonic-acid transferase